MRILRLIRAFDQMVLKDIMDAKKNDSGYWQNILMGHAVQGKIHRKQIADGKQVI